MANEQAIMRIEAEIQSQRRAEVIEAGGQYLPLVRAVGRGSVLHHGAKR